MLRPINHAIDDIQSFQTNMYQTFSQITADRPMQARLWSIPIAMLDIGLDILKTPLLVIDCLARAAIAMFSALWSSGRTLRDSIALIEAAACTVLAIPVQLLLSPIRVTIQVVAIIRNPAEVYRYNPVDFPRIQ
jgi:hypothetical protein